MGRERVMCCWQVDGVLIDPGPESSVQTLLEALGDEPPEAILITHIHLDHAGATGSLVQRWPELPVYVHELGAPHLIDPEKLEKSAGRLWDDMEERWGHTQPVPEERITLVGDGDAVRGFRVAYTPGHASHHVSYLHEESGWAFVGDVAGVRIPPSELVVAPTPPPDIDVAAWERSLDLVAGWSPERLALTHWGEAEDPAEQLEACRRALREEAELARERDLDGFMAILHERIAADAPELIETYEQAAPLDHLFLGLDRWHSKQAA